MFESSSMDDELQLILNIAIDEGIEVAILRSRNSLGLPTAMLNEMGFIHDRIDCVTMIAGDDGLDMSIVKNVLSRVKQLADIGVSFSFGSGTTQQVDQWFVHDDLDVLPERVNYVRFFLFPRLGAFEYDNTGGFYGIQHTVYHTFEKNRFTLWTSNPPGSKNGPDVKYHADGREILSIRFDRLHYYIEGANAGDNIHKMYGERYGLNIASINYEFNGDVSYPYKYIIELEE